MIFPKKPQILYAPMLSTFGGGSAIGFRASKAEPLAFSADKMPLSRLASTITPTSKTITDPYNFTSGGMFVNDGGNHMFLFDGNTVRRYSFGTQHDLSTLSGTNSDSWNPPSGNRAFAMSANGQKSFTVEETSQNTYTWSHNSYFPSNASGAGSTSLNATGNAAYPHTIRFNSNGTKFIVHWYQGTSNLQYYTTSSPYDIGGRSLQSSGGGVSTGTRNIAVSDDGTFLCYIQPAVTTLYSYYMSTPWDVSTLYGGQSYSNFLSGFNVHGAMITGNYLYFAGEDQVRQYDIS